MGVGWRVFVARDLTSLRSGLRAREIAGILRRQTFAYFAWSDPMPAIARMLKPLRRLFKSRTAKPPVIKTAVVAKAAGEGALA